MATMWLIIMTPWRCPLTKAPTTFLKWTRSPRKAPGPAHRKSWLILYHIVWIHEWKCCVHTDLRAALVVSYPLVFMFCGWILCRLVVEAVTLFLYNVPLVRRTCLGVVRPVDRLVMCFKHLFCCHNHTLYCNNILLKFYKSVRFAIRFYIETWVNFGIVS